MLVYVTVIQCTATQWRQLARHPGSSKGHILCLSDSHGLWCAKTVPQLLRQSKG